MEREEFIKRLSLGLIAVCAGCTNNGSIPSPAPAKTVASTGTGSTGTGTTGTGTTGSGTTGTGTTGTTGTGTTGTGTGTTGAGTTGTTGTTGTGTGTTGTGTGTTGTGTTGTGTGTTGTGTGTTGTSTGTGAPTLASNQTAVNLATSLLTVGSQVRTNGILVFRIAAANAPASFVAVQGQCTHQGGNLNWKANGPYILCADHAAEFNTAGVNIVGPNGRAAGTTANLKVYTTAVTSGNYLVITT